MGTDDKLLKEIKNIAKVNKIPLKQVFNYVKNLKPKKKNLDLKYEIVFLFTWLARPLWGKKGWSKRKAIVRTAKHPRFKKILDNHYKGAARKAFDDKTKKDYNSSSHIKDLGTIGLYKRYKLVDNKLNRLASKKFLDTILDRNNYQQEQKKLREELKDRFPKTLF